MNFMQKKSVHMNSLWIFFVKFTCNFSAEFQTAISYMHLPWNLLLMLFSDEFHMKMSLNFTWSTMFTVILKTSDTKKKKKPRMPSYLLHWEKCLWFWLHQWKELVDLGCWQPQQQSATIGRGIQTVNQKMQYSVSKKGIQDIQKNIIWQIRDAKVDPDYGSIIPVILVILT